MQLLLHLVPNSVPTRPYDSRLGQWMTPAQSWTQHVLKGFDSVDQLFAYRWDIISIS